MAKMSPPNSSSSEPPFALVSTSVLSAFTSSIFSPEGCSGGTSGVPIISLSRTSRTYWATNSRIEMAGVRSLTVTWYGRPACHSAALGGQQRNTHTGTVGSNGDLKPFDMISLSAQTRQVARPDCGMLTASYCHLIVKNILDAVAN